MSKRINVHLHELVDMIAVDDNGVYYYDNGKWYVLNWDAVAKIHWYDEETNLLDPERSAHLDKLFKDQFGLS